MKPQKSIFFAMAILLLHSEIFPQNNQNEKKQTEAQEKIEDVKNSKHLDEIEPEEGISIAKNLRVNGFAEANYAYDFNHPPDRERLYTSNPLKSNDFQVSYAYSKVTYDSEKVKMNFALHTGNIARFFYANEPVAYQYIRAANASYCFTKSICLDAGIFPSIYGFETFISMENMHASRAIMTDFAPDFEAGVKLSFQITPRLSGKLQVTNGWQILQETNKDKAFGTLLQYNIVKKLHLNWGSYTGNDKPDTEKRQTRYYQNLFAKYQWNGFAFGPMLDILHQKKPDEDGFYKSVNYALTIRYQFTNYFAMAVRGERFRDPHELILASNTKAGFSVDDYTLTLEFTPVDNVLMRIEGRTFHSKDKIFPRTDNYLQQDKYPITQQRNVNSDQFLMASLAVWF